MTPRPQYILTAFVWTCAILCVAMLIAYMPLIVAVIKWSLDR